MGTDTPEETPQIETPEEQTSPAPPRQEDAPGEAGEIELETAQEAREADEENAEAEEMASEDAAENLTMEADEAAGLKKTEEREAAARKAQEPLSERFMEGLSGGWRHFTEAASRIWDRIAALLKRFGRWLWSWKRWQKVLAIVLLVVLIVPVAAYGYFHSKYTKMDISEGVYVNNEVISEEETEEDNEELISRLESGELKETEAIEATGEIYTDEEVFNILLIGTDDRTVEFSENARGDTCILLSINMATGKINLVSFERATGVKIPSGDYEGQWDWLTHMFWYGGPDMMMSVIRDNFKVDVTKYVRVNIRTYMKLVDAVGGVDIDMTEAEVNNINHPEGSYTADHIKSLGVEDEVQQDLVVGVNHLNGATAMLYARLRSIDSDWYRVVRQRNVLMAAFENLKSMSLTEIDSFLDEVLPMVQTNLTEADIATLMTQIPAFLDMEFESITFPLQNTYGLMSGMAGRRVLAVDFETNAQELQNLLSGEIEADELAEKYENLEDELEDYSYKDSEVYQENYADAESIAGRTYSYSYSYSSSSATAASGSGGAEAAADVDDGLALEEGAEEIAEESDAESAANSLGVVESVTTDEATGVITIIYYNEVTGVRTAVASDPATGTTSVASDADGGSEVTVYYGDTGEGMQEETTEETSDSESQEEISQTEAETTEDAALEELMSDAAVSDAEAAGESSAAAGE